jgi:hypothetical protein
MILREFSDEMRNKKEIVMFAVLNDQNSFRFASKPFE